MPLSDAEKYLKDGLSLEEVAVAAKSLLEQGKPIVDPEPEEAARQQAEKTASTLLSLFKPLEEFPAEEAKWLAPGWIPEAQITVIAADGGIGKTTLWCNIIAALSNGGTCILDPPGVTRQPVKVTFLTTEDSVRKKLRKSSSLPVPTCGTSSRRTLQRTGTGFSAR